MLLHYCVPVIPFSPSTRFAIGFHVPWPVQRQDGFGLLLFATAGQNQYRSNMLWFCRSCSRKGGMSANLLASILYFCFFETPGEKPHGQGLCALSPANANSRLTYLVDLRTAGDGSIQPRRLAASSQPRLWMLSIGFLFKALCEQAFRGKLCRFSFSSVRAFWFHDAR